MDIDTSDIKQLRKKDKFGETVAHRLARENELPIEHMTEEVLSIPASDGYTVAHTLATKGNLPEQLITPKILRLGLGTRYRTIAHALARGGVLPKYLIDKDLLKLADKDKWSLAHEIAMSKFEDRYSEFLTDPEILLLEDIEGKYVYQLLEKYRGRLKSVDNAKDDFELYLLAMSKYKYPKTSFDKFKDTVKKHGLEKMKKIVKLSGTK